MSKQDSVSRRQQGFTLVEALITVAVIGILALMLMPAFLGTLNRTRLTGTSREVQSLFQVARLEAIKMNTLVEVNYDAADNRFIAFVDMDRDGVETVPPDRRLTSVIQVARKVEFRGPGDANPNGANAIDIWDGVPDLPAKLGPVFNPDGSVDRAGAYRFADFNGNFLEVRIESPATGRIVIKKWFPADSAFFAREEQGHTWVWQ